MKVFLCLCVLVAVVHCVPVPKDQEKGSVAKFSPVEKTEDHAGEEDLEPAAQFWGGWGGRSGGWSGSFERGGWGGGGWGGWGGRGGWGGGWGGGWSGSGSGFWG